MPVSMGSTSASSPATILEVPFLESQVIIVTKVIHSPRGGRGATSELCCLLLNGITDYFAYGNKRDALTTAGAYHHIFDDGLIDWFF